MSWDVGAGLEGRGVVCTGAAGGIGRAVTAAFAATGARVLAVDLDEGWARASIADLPGEGHAAVGLDLRDLSSHARLVRTAETELGGLDVLAHLAAVLQRRPSIGEVTEADWDLQSDVNLKAAFFLCRAAAESMKARGRGGRIVTFASQGWWTGGFGGSIAYAATKGGVVTMTRGLARTYGPDGITVNAVSPGQVSTPMLTTGLDPAVLERMRADTPLGRVAEPEELAGPVVFLASQHASFITGATLNVSGGFLMY
jgi:NAD(P)-dependent dehydrogenase (short-subunit alcohol dehydrogenase family)